MAARTRGRIPAPNLDDRDWAALVDEARALIPRYAPQWTDHSPSDLGITLIELFAYLVEGLTFKLNQVPEKHYVEFLNLLGITRDPQVPAKAYLTFRATPAGANITVPTGQQAQTRGSETEKPVVFETDEPLVVRPTNLAVALEVAKFGFSSRYRNRSSELTQRGAVGGSFNLPNGQTMLLFGFDAPVTALDLGFELSKPLAPAVASTLTVDWHYSSGTVVPAFWPAATATDATQQLREDGVVSLQLPTTWASQRTSAWGNAPGPLTANDVPPDVPLYWIAARIQNTTGGPVELGVRRVLFNTVAAHNALTVTGEQLGVSDGTPFQVFALANGPLFRRSGTDTPYDHLVLTVNGTPWSLAEDLPAGPSQSYRLDPVAAEVGFGDYDLTLRPEGHGSIPPAGAAIEAATYRYAAGGAAGNVGAGTIVVMTTPIAGIIGVENLGAAEGGADEEPIEEAKRRAPEVLRNRGRAVTAEDYEYLAREVSTDVAVVRALPPRMHLDTSLTYTQGDPWMYGQLDRGAGNVTVIVVPRTGIVAARPEPTKDLLVDVQRALDRRRDITARLHITGPRYLPVKAVVVAWVWQRAIDLGLVTTAAQFYTDIRNRVLAFLHPVQGGPNGAGWAVGQHIFIKDVYEAAMPDEELGYISSLTIEPEVPAYTPTDRPFPVALTGPGAWVAVADYELVCAGQPQIVTNPPVPEF
jgi:hypothetical protein